MGFEGVVLAAGYSRRIGAFKMTLEAGNATIIEKCIAGMYELCSRVIVVSGYQASKLEHVLAGYPKIEIVFNENYHLGMFSSVKTGFRQVRSERFFFTPGDYPMIGREVYAALANVNGEVVIPVYRGFMGHPLLMQGDLAHELVEDSCCANLREFIARKALVPVEVQDPGILQDIDTIDDYQKMISGLSENAPQC